MSRSKRTEVLDAAERCFYESGIAASGVDTIAERAGVSKRTLYNHFPSKDALVIAYLERREVRWRAAAAAAIALEGPVERLRGFVTAYVAPALPDEPYRGCALLNAAAELPDDHPALEVVVASKRRTGDELEKIFAALGADDPAAAAHAASLMLEGRSGLSGVMRQAVDVDPLVDTLLSVV